jgi:hypothetical protein
MTYYVAWRAFDLEGAKVDSIKASRIAFRKRSRRFMKTNGAAVFASAVVALIAGCGPTGPAASTSPSPSAAASPTLSISPSAAQSPTAMSVATANAEIRSSVTGAHPVLLPSSISSTWSATLMTPSPAFFDVIYQSPDATQEVELAIVVPNPPPPGPNGSQTQPKFHGDANSLYQVNDKTQATSDRLLMWNEPGTWTEPNGLPGVPYLLTSRGLTDAEFWAVANSLK